MSQPPRLSDQKLADLLATARIDPDGVLMVNPRALEALVSECQAARRHFRGRGPLCRELEGSELRFLRIPPTRDEVPLKTKTGERTNRPRSSRRAS